jgi:hypothetical protein
MRKDNPFPLIPLSPSEGEGQVEGGYKILFERNTNNYFISDAQY